MAARPPSSAVNFEKSMIDGMNAAGIADRNERAMFVSQMALESQRGRFMYEIWGPTAHQRKYEGHRGLGNTQPGDGYRFRGRGFIQLTGRDNYTRAGRALGIDLISNPDLAAREDIAALVAIWYWQNHASGRIPPLARKGDVYGVTGLINGPGRLHLKEREALYREYLQRSDITTYVKPITPISLPLPGLNKDDNLTPVRTSTTITFKR